MSRSCYLLSGVAKARNVVSHCNNTSCNSSATQTAFYKSPAVSVHLKRKVTLKKKKENVAFHYLFSRMLPCTTRQNNSFSSRIRLMRHVFTTGEFHGSEILKVIRETTRAIV
ncbi:hypothetical protein CDAR_42511 [Caerostris darwini]|uniref:Uncharacterized protein n=1 Tax=Caerostris darwini TaxID=1538125 RepID=A0AAV4RLA1_9ARAC|nr:hypothetical protein CDAR_42511 [Caerostris darwini]